ncbi:MAG TPA: hypothetical protein VF550_02405, partial [Polyangia bacterium]
GQWPRDRYIELAPKYWSKTRARLDPVELANEVGPLTIPPAAGAVVVELKAPPFPCGQNAASGGDPKDGVRASDT